jgi:hypothetical protein
VLTSTRRLVSLLGIVLVSLAAVLHAQRSPLQLGQRVPDFVVAAAERPGSPDSFVRALAHLSIPVVAVIGSQPSIGREVTLGSDKRSGDRSLSWALNRFEKRHLPYSVSSADGVVVVMPVRLGCRAVLDRVITLRSRGPAFKVIFDLARSLDPSLPDIPPGIVQGGGADVGPSVFERSLEVNLSGRTVLDAMTELAARSPGLVWAVRETSSDPGKMGAATKCTLTLLAGTHTLWTSYELK